MEVGGGWLQSCTVSNITLFVRYIMDVVKLKKRTENDSQEMKSFDGDNFELQVRRIALLEK